MGVINCIIITSTILTLAAVDMSAGVAKGTEGGLLHSSRFLKLPMEGVLMTWGVLGPAPTRSPPVLPLEQGLELEVGGGDPG